jgi:hypothetical protein
MFIVNYDLGFLECFVEQYLIKNWRLRAYIEKAIMKMSYIANLKMQFYNAMLPRFGDDGCG